MLERGEKEEEEKIKTGKEMQQPNPVTALGHVQIPFKIPGNLFISFNNSNPC